MKFFELLLASEIYHARRRGETDTQCQKIREELCRAIWSQWDVPKHSGVLVQSILEARRIQTIQEESLLREFEQLIQHSQRSNVDGNSQVDSRQEILLLDAEQSSSDGDEDRS